MNFEFATANRILFGEGKRREIANMARRLARRSLLVTGKDAARAWWLKEALESEGCPCDVFSVPGEPTVQMAQEGAEAARSGWAEVVIGIGGGSVMDAAKAIAALATNTGPALDYLEVIGQGQPLLANPLPVIAVPTTAGTGSEVTRNAVLASPDHQVKVSLRSAKMLPVAAVVDPELTRDLPGAITAYTGLDALTQLIEPFLCTRANPMTDALCREALPRVAQALQVTFRDGRNSEARRAMALGSLFGGMALANAGLGAVHGFAAPIGGMFDAPHGAVCAALLPGTLAVNLKALRSRGNGTTLARFDELACLLTGSQKARADDAVAFVEKLVRELQVSGLGAFGVGADSFEVLCERAARASSMKANPVELTAAELREILDLAA